MTEPTNPPGWKPADHEVIEQVTSILMRDGRFDDLADMLEAAITPPPPKPERYGPRRRIGGRFTEKETREWAAEAHRHHQPAIRYYLTLLCRCYVDHNLWTDSEGNPLPYPGSEGTA